MLARKALFLSSFFLAGLQDRGLDNKSIYSYMSFKEAAKWIKVCRDILESTFKSEDIPFSILMNKGYLYGTVVLKWQVLFQNLQLLRKYKLDQPMRAPSWFSENHCFLPVSWLMCIRQCSFSLPLPFKTFLFLVQEGNHTLLIHKEGSHCFDSIILITPLLTNHTLLHII